MDVVIAIDCAGSGWNWADGRSMPYLPSGRCRNIERKQGADFAFSLSYYPGTEVQIPNSRWSASGGGYKLKSGQPAGMRGALGSGIERVERSCAPCGDDTAEGFGMKISIWLHEKRVILCF